MRRGFRPGELFGGIGSGLIPVFAIACGILIGMGGAYVVKRVLFGGVKKRSELSMLEDRERVPGRTRLRQQARARPVEATDMNEDKSLHLVRVGDSTPAPVQESVSQASQPIAEPRAPVKPDSTPADAALKHSVPASGAGARKATQHVSLTPQKHRELSKAKELAETKTEKTKKGSDIVSKDSHRRAGEEFGEGDTGDGLTLRNRVEGISKAKKKEETEAEPVEEDEDTSFQNRLKKSLE